MSTVKSANGRPPVNDKIYTFVFTETRKCQSSCAEHDVHGVVKHTMTFKNSVSHSIWRWALYLQESEPKWPTWKSSSGCGAWSDGVCFHSVHPCASSTSSFSFDKLPPGAPAVSWLLELRPGMAPFNREPSDTACPKCSVASGLSLTMPQCQFQDILLYFNARLFAAGRIGKMSMGLPPPDASCRAQRKRGFNSHWQNALSMLLHCTYFLCHCACIAV
jgi:hypothetical protein